jgi:hypothetical protein
MAKFWRSGMIDKKVVAKREQDEYINKLQRTILELRYEEPEYATFYDDKGQPYTKMKIDRKKPLTPTQSAKKWGEGVRALFTGEYDEVRQGDDITLEFHNWLIKNADKRYKADIEFSRKIAVLENENNTRDI